jgi:hypothetical protein
MRAWRKCLQRRRNVGQSLSSCHLNKHNLINSLRANLDERTVSSDDALHALPPKISPILRESQHRLRFLGSSDLGTIDGPVRHRARAHGLTLSPAQLAGRGTRPPEDTESAARCHRLRTVRLWPALPGQPHARLRFHCSGELFLGRVDWRRHRHRGHHGQGQIKSSHGSLSGVTPRPLPGDHACASTLKEPREGPGAASEDPCH